MKKILFIIILFLTICLMILPKPEKEKNNMAETWVLNKLASSTLGNETFNVSFKSNNNSYNKIVCDRLEQEALYYDSTRVWIQASWNNEAYKTIVFDNPVTDSSLLTWLQANGTKQTVETITDLTGYTWVGNESLSLRDYNGSTWTINFTSNNENFNQINILARGPQQELRYLPNKDENQVVYDFPSGWRDEAYKTIQITGGTDATNSDLIAWLQANGNLIKQTPVSNNKIIYANKEISKLYVGTKVVKTIYQGTKIIYNN